MLEKHLSGGAITTAQHQWNPADYARHSEGQERWARNLLSLLHVQPTEAVLDIGCGDGRITAEIARQAHAGRVVGIDSSAEMIRFAGEHFPSSQFPNLMFRRADASALPFDSEFDAVFSNAVLHWILDHRPVLAGVARSLRPGGRSVLEMGGKGNGEDVVRAMDACLSESKWQAAPALRPHYGFYDPGEYRGWLLAAGLQPDSVELIEKDMVHASVAAFTGWLRTAWLPYTERVPEERRDQFLDAVSRLYISTNPPDEAGQVHVRMMRLRVFAHKPSVSAHS
jgi:trans-aconitate methyltransferase